MSYCQQLSFMESLPNVELLNNVVKYKQTNPRYNSSNIQTVCSYNANEDAFSSWAHNPQCIRYCQVCTQSWAHHFQICSLLLIRDGQIPDSATQTQADFCKMLILSSDCTYHIELDNFWFPAYFALCFTHSVTTVKSMHVSVRWRPDTVLRPLLQFYVM